MVGIEYCEKAIYSGYLEPINFFSNLFIIAAALSILAYMKKHKIKDIKSKVLVSLVFLTGIGSMSWHLIQTAPTLLLDILPVMIFIFTSIYLIFQKITKNNTKAAAALAIIFAIIPLFVWASSLLLNISTNGPPFLGIIPALAFTVGFIYYKDKETFKRTLLPLSFFAAAIFFRQIDLIACNIIPFGTHFMWHLMNSFAAYYLFLAVYER